LRKAAFALVLAAFLAVLAGALAKPRSATAKVHVYPAPGGVAKIVRKIHLYRQTTWRWQRVMGLRPTRVSGAPLVHSTIGYRIWVLNLWKTRARRVERLAENPPHKADWLCIHRYEASWTDGGGPYFGGLQMDLSFQQHYGRALLASKGTAEHWTPLEQMWVAERALRSGRGFYPWPSTAHFCGLI
jgi:hypothetical protein